MKKYLKQINRLLKIDEQVINNILQGGTYLLETRTGWGKTTLGVILSLILAYEGYRVLFYTRTNTEISEVYMKFKQYINKFPNTFTPIILPLLGKEFYCPYTELDIYKSPYRLCENLRRTKACILYKKYQSINPRSIIPDIIRSEHLEDVVLNILEHNACPYYTIKSLISSANIIIGTYYFLFNQPHYLQLKPFKYAIIVDEAHNLPEYYTNMHILTVPEKCIIEILEEIENRGLNQHKKLIDLYYRTLNKKDRSNMLDILSSIIYITQENPYILDNLTCDNQDFISSLTSIYPKHVLLAKKVRRIDNTIFLEFAYTKDSIRNILTYSFLNLFLSATLSPRFLYIRFLKRISNLNKITYINDIAPQTKGEIELIFISGFSSRYKERSRIIVEQIAEGIFHILKLYGNSIIFTVSKEYLYKILNETQFFSTIEIIDDIELFIQKIKLGLDKIGLILTYRSRYSEGINILRNIKVRNIILTGLPVPPPSPRINFLVNISYGYRDRNSAYKYGYLHPALTSTIQSIGRVIKEETQDLKIFIFEDRLKELLLSKMTPKWFRNMILIKTINYNDLKGY